MERAGIALAAARLGAAAVIGTIVALAAAAASAEAVSAPPTRAPGAAKTDDRVSAVQTSGEASYRICRYGLFSLSCQIYGHIRLPEVIARGDRLIVTFGSNRRQVRFTVKSIRLTGTGCELFATTGDEKADRLRVPHCTLLPDAR